MKKISPPRLFGFQNNGVNSLQSCCLFLGENYVHYQTSSLLQLMPFMSLIEQSIKFLYKYRHLTLTEQSKCYTHRTIQT